MAQNTLSIKPDNDPLESRGSVLLVDDQPANLLALEAVLGDLGHELVKAQSGEEALRLVLKQDFAVVLLDVQMPGLGGFETARLIRGRERSRHLPVIFLTARDDDRLGVEQAYALGAVDYLVKPIVPVVLRAKVTGFVELFHKTEQVKRQAEQLRLLERREFERKLAEENLRLQESEERLRTLSNNLPLGAIYQIVADPRGVRRFTHVSAGVEQVFGVTPAEVMADATTLYGLVHQEDQPRLAATEETAHHSLAPFDCEFRSFTRSGELRWIHARSAPRQLPGGEIGWDGILMDVTDWRRTEREARVDRDRLDLVVNSVDVGLWYCDLPFDRLHWNAKVKEHFGLPADHEVTIDTFYERLHPDDRERTRRAIDRSINDRIGYDVEYRTVGLDGRERWVRAIGRAFYDPSGQPLSFDGITVDVTDRKQAETAVRESEERFRTLADSIPQLAWTADPEGYIYWYNRRWYEYTGTTLEDMKGWGWQSLHDPAELPRVLERWNASIATGEPFDMVFPLRGRDGLFRQFLTRVMPLRNDSGRIIQWFGTNTDVSEITEMQAKLEDADRRKDQFVMMLAHELRNPLAPIRNGLQILRVAWNDPPVVEQTRRMMERQVGHVTRIIEDLLDVSRLLRGRVELRPDRHDLGRLARTVLDDQRAAFDQAGVRLTSDLPELPVWVNADATRLTQVLDNLLQNAIKFTDRGGTVTVKVGADPALATLAVHDTGVGIEPDLLPHLFETFTQADNSLDRSKGGLGLGLSLVKGLVELHGGQVQARSGGPGRGAEFVVRLPLQPEPVAVTMMPAEPEHTRKRLRVLVVEDNRDAADSLKMLLELFGYDVTVAYTGLTGVASAKELRPDVVLCDIGLPGLDGYGVARELRQNPTTAKTRIIAVTGYGSDEDRRRSREAGFDAHVTKPADPTTLHELLTAI